ncbi:MAG: Uncharacterized protein CEN91_114, partial [Candidatus Berkelbacteria bacterium Licking1014_85]
MKIHSATKNLSLAQSVKDDLRAELRDSLISVIFYGSRAKGNAKNDSDLDLFLLMN